MLIDDRLLSTIVREAQIESSQLGDVLVPEGFEVDVESLFERSARRTWIAAGVAAGLFSLYAIGILIWFAVLDGDVGSYWGVPAPGLAMLALGGLGIIVLVSVPFWRPIERHLSREYRIPVYRMGTTPWGRSTLIIGEAAVLVVGPRGEICGRFPRSAVDVVVLSPGRGGVAAVIAAWDRFFEVSLVLRANGPVAPAWSWGGASGRRGLEQALRTDLGERGYQVADATR